MSGSDDRHAEPGSGWIGAGNHHAHAVPAPGSPPETDDRENERLVARYQQEFCVQCLDTLLQRNEGLLHHVLKRFSYTDEPYEDLFQVARLGLIKAAQRYDPSKGTAFTTYAVAVVDGEVRHYLRDSLLVRQPRWARALYRRIQEAQSEFYHKHRRSPTIGELAQLVNIREEGVLEIIRAAGATNLHSLDEPFSRDPPTQPDKSLVRALRQEAFALPVEDRVMLYEAVAALSDLHKKIIYLLFFRDLTQQEVAEEMGMSQRAVSREQTKALARLKAVLGRKLL
ncbi:MAG: sigma-70 family RNA polymerase sigma factor [Actinobacteria bacterium]|nr:sigma-70 family RNA polymerase sigma factor [Actinomycetota bacterium]